jgi:hypothetical protein
MAIVFGCLSLLSFPFGTALGIYMGAGVLEVWTPVPCSRLRRILVYFASAISSFPFSSATP